MRDLTKDLEICEKATEGPWELKVKGNTVKSYAIDGVCHGMKKDGRDAEFIAEARTGWPEAIRRALEAEEENAKLREQIEQLKEALIVIADAPEQTWKPAQVFRSDEQVFIDEAIHDGVKNMADIARIALGLPEWGTLEQIKQGTAKKALSETV